MAKIDELDDKKRTKTLQQSVKGLAGILDNSDGLRRLRAISEAKWRRAEARDAAESK